MDSNLLITMIGVVVAASFWIVTQWNIISTKNHLSARVIKAGDETKAQAIDTVLGMEKRVNESLTKVEAVIAALPKFDEDMLAIDYEEMAENLKPVLGPMVSEHVGMAINQAKAQETKSLQAQLETLGLDEVIGEAKEQVLAQLPPEALAYKRMMDSRPSKKWSNEHPIETQLYEGMKILFSQYAQGQGLLPGGREAAAEARPVSTGFGVR